MSKPPQSHLSIPGRSSNNNNNNDDDSSEPGEDEDENDPFADRNAVITPRVERSEPSWS